MTDFDWTPETAVALVALLVFLLTADWSVAETTVKKVGCAALVGLTLGLWHPCKADDTKPSTPATEERRSTP